MLFILLHCHDFKFLTAKSTSKFDVGPMVIQYRVTGASGSTMLFNIVNSLEHVGSKILFNLVVINFEDIVHSGSFLLCNK